MDTSKLTFAVFTLDESDHCFAGYHDPAMTWNGWNCPVFPAHEVERMRVVWQGIEDVDMDQAVADTKMPADSPFLPIGSHSWTWFEAPMGLGREYFLDPIRTRDEAEAFILLLAKDGLLWHFDDHPDTIISGATNSPLFTDAEAAAADCRAHELFDVMGDPFGLPVALTNAEGGRVFRVDWVEGYATADGTCAYLTAEELNDEANGYSQEYRDQAATMAVGQTISMAGVLDVANLTRIA